MLRTLTKAQLNKLGEAVREVTFKANDVIIRKVYGVLVVFAVFSVACHGHCVLSVVVAVPSVSIAVNIFHAVGVLV